ncbi:MAG: TonB-dependent receptor, partial [Comamonadaceae bacterium]
MSATTTFGSTTLVNTIANTRDGFIAKLLDAGPSASYQWVQNIGGPGEEFVWALAANGSALYVGGEFGASATFGGLTLQSTTAVKGYVAKLTDNGLNSSFTWVQPVSATVNSTTKALAVSGAQVYATGLYAGTATLGPTTLPSGGVPLRFQDTASDSLAVMDSMHLLDDRLHLIGGLRYQKLDIGEFSAGVERRRFEQTATAPSLGASYKLARGLSVYANYAEGLSQGPVAGGSTANAGQVFPPFKGKQIEAGVKYDAGAFGASAALFQIRQPVSFVNGANFLVVDGEQRNRGLELSLYGEVAKNLRLNAGLALFDAVQSKTLNGANDGKKAIGIPDYNLVLNGEWDLAALPGLTVTGRLTKVASQIASANNTQSIPGFDSYD